jgi:hypothetical protein
LRKLILHDIVSVRSGKAPRVFANAQGQDGAVKIDSYTGLRRKGIS